MFLEIRQIFLVSRTSMSGLLLFLFFLFNKFAYIITLRNFFVCSVAQIGLRVFFHLLFTECFKFYQAGLEAFLALFLEQHFLPLKFLLDLPLGHSRFGSPRLRLDDLLALCVIAAAHPNRVAAASFLNCCYSKPSNLQHGVSLLSLLYHFHALKLRCFF